MSNMKAVTIFTEDGEDRDYVPVSRRLPDFMREYPPQEGWQVRVGQYAPAEFGLDMPGWVVCRAALFSPEGHEVNSGSSLFPVVGYKDWEKGETAARQRLLAALGFGGDILDQDEHNDMQAQGLSVAPKQQSASVRPIQSKAEEARANLPPVPKPDAKPEPKTEAEVVEPQEHEPVADAAPEAAEPEAEQQEKVEATESAKPEPAEEQPAKSKAKAAKSKTKKGGEIPAYIMRQIENICFQKEVDPPKAEDFASVDEAKAYYKKLLQS